MKKIKNIPPRKPATSTPLQQATIEQLKVAVYDRLAMVQQLQREIAELNNEISQRSNPPIPKPSENRANPKATA